MLLEKPVFLPQLPEYCRRTTTVVAGKRRWRKRQITLESIKGNRFWMTVIRTTMGSAWKSPWINPTQKSPPKGTKETSYFSKFILAHSTPSILTLCSYNFRHSNMRHANFMLLLCGIFFCWYSHVSCPLASLGLWSNVIFIVSSFMTHSI